MTPTIGRIVHYRLNEKDAQAINRRRTTGASITEFIGSTVSEGDTLPLIVCRVWPDEYGLGVPGVNGQVFLDGNDTLWVTSAPEGTTPGTWSWPPRT